MSVTHKQKKIHLSDEDVAFINSKIGLKYLFADKKPDLEKVIRMTKYENELKGLQAELIKLQEWTAKNEKKIVILFEGRDAAGKGGAIRRMTAHINPRQFRIIALPKPSKEEEGQWYFQRYINQLPQPGEIVFFDRSWYNRAVVEPVNDFCTQDQYNTFMGQVNDFERMLLESDTYLIKFYFSITKGEQARRFNDIKTSPLKRWKMTTVDEKAQELWDEYTKYKVKMFEYTNTKICPWIIIEADKKTKARVEAIQYVLDKIPYTK
ncbi:polyphosphate kinase 2 [Aquimarina sp. M1]